MLARVNCLWSLGHGAGAPGTLGCGGVGITGHRHQAHSHTGLSTRHSFHSAEPNAHDAGAENSRGSRCVRPVGRGGALRFPPGPRFHCGIVCVAMVLARKAHGDLSARAMRRPPPAQCTAMPSRVTGLKHCRAREESTPSALQLRMRGPGLLQAHGARRGLPGSGSGMPFEEGRQREPVACSKMAARRVRHALGKAHLLGERARDIPSLHARTSLRAGLSAGRVVHPAGPEEAACDGTAGVEGVELKGRGLSRRIDRLCWLLGTVSSHATATPRAQRRETAGSGP